MAIAAAYATIGLGTDTGGSIRGPSTTNGIVGLKPTHGLLSRAGIIPLALSFDTGGPMARSVYDVAAALGVMTGVDPADAATKKSDGKFADRLHQMAEAPTRSRARGSASRATSSAPIADVDWVIEAAFAAMGRRARRSSTSVTQNGCSTRKGEFYNTMRYPEFVVQIAEYLKTTGPKYPKTLDEMIERANHSTRHARRTAPAQPSRWTLFKREAGSGTLDDYRYTAVRDYGLPTVRGVVEGMLAAQKLDAIVYPTSSRRPALITRRPPPDAPAARRRRVSERTSRTCRGFRI